jgi:predicted enzyme related to lactoylglutathione lyase
MPNPICHWELMVNDVEKAKRFYGGVFRWRFDDAKYPGYTLIDTGEGVGGGMIRKPPGAPMASLNTYFAVDDLDRTLRDVVESGGSVIVPRTEIPTVGWFAMFLDPDQIPIGVLQPLPMEKADRPPSWDDVRRIADELEVKAHLATLDLRDRWRALQPQLAQVERQIADAGGKLSMAISKQLTELGKTLRAMLDELGRR